MLLQGPRIDKKHTSFWFVVGLKYHETHDTELLARHLTLLAIFYHAQDRTMIAEGLLSRALDLTKGTHSFHRAFACKMYAHILGTKSNRETEVKKLTEESEFSPEWMNRLVNLQIPT